MNMRLEHFNFFKNVICFNLRFCATQWREIFLQRECLVMVDLFHRNYCLFFKDFFVKLLACFDLV